MNEDDHRDNPFVGLRPFFDKDSFYFFGRNEQVTELLELLHTTHFVPVLGGSGSGKSSLVRAGLIPTLRAGFMVAERDGWRMAKCLPGDAPIENLAEALLRAVGVERTPVLVNALATHIREDFDDAVIEVLRPHLTAQESVLILVDQFEELFAFRSAAGAGSDDELDAAPDAARTADRLRRRRDSSLLVAVLLALAERTDVPVYVVTTMRTDFLGDCDVFTGLPEAINRSGYLVPRLTRAQLRSTIEGPARLVGARAAPRLVDRILNDVGDRMDRLPLMQHALLRTYEAWKDAGMIGPIDLADLDMIGGLDGALNVQAEATIADIDPRVAERVFKRLTTTDKSLRRVRHPTRLSDLRAVVGRENEAGLMTLLDRCVSEGTNFMFASPDGQPNNPRYDITHESLIRQWSRLRTWVDEEQVQRDWYVGVASRAALYASDPDTGLMSARDLRIADDVLRERQPTAGWATRYPEAATSFDSTIAYFRKSSKHAKARRRNVILSAAAILLVVVGATLTVVVSRQAVIKVLARVNTVARYRVIERLLNDDPTYAAALAAELTDTTEWNSEYVALLQRAVNADYATAEYRGVSAYDFDGTGRQIAIAYVSGRVEVGDIDGAGAPHTIFQSPASDTAIYVRFVKGNGVLVAYRDGTVRLWRSSDSASTTPITTPRRWKLPVSLQQLLVGADSTSLIAVDDSSRLFTWSLDESTPRALLAKERVSEIYTHPTDPHRTVVTTITPTNAPDSLRVVDVQAGKVVATLKKVSRRVDFVSFNEANDEMLIGQYRGRVLYMRGDRPVGEFGDSTGNVSAAFNNGFGSVLVTTEFGFLDLYTISSTADGKHKPRSRVGRFLAHEEFASAEISRDGNWIVSWSSDGAIRLTATGNSLVTTKLLGHRDNVRRALTTPTDSRIASIDIGGTLRIWRIPGVTKAVPLTTFPGLPVATVLSRDGSRALFAYSEGTHGVYSLRDAAPSVVFEVPIGTYGIAPVLSTTGRYVFFDEPTSEGRFIWNLADSARVRLADGREALRAATFSDDDSLLVLAHADGRISFFNAITGAPLGDHRYSGGSSFAAMSAAPHTHRVAVSYGDTVMLIDKGTAIGVKHESYGASVWDLKFGADGRSLLLIDDMGGAEVVKLDARKRPGSDSLNFQIDNGGRNVTASAISATGAFLAIATDDRRVWIHDLRATPATSLPSEIKGLEGTTVHLTFGADERTLVGTSSDGDINIWRISGADAWVSDTTTLALQHTPRVPHLRRLPFAETVLSSDGKTLTSVVVPDSGPPRLGKWDLDYSRLSRQLRRTTTACLDVTVRKRLLPNETDSERSERTAACEARARRAKP